MFDQKLTGNPVFDYRAGFRREAGIIQQGLIWGGFVVVVLGGALALFAANKHLHHLGGKICLNGVFTILLGVAWGFYWRHKIREEFKSRFQ